MAVYKPEFLKDVKRISPRQSKQLMELMRNWVILAKNIKTVSEDDLKKMIILEINGKRRIQIIQRLKSRFNTLRLERENIELTSIGVTRETH